MYWLSYIYSYFLQGFAFINYHKKDDAAKAIATLNGFGYDHLILNVEWAKPSGTWIFDALFQRESST